MNIAVDLHGTLDTYKNLRDCIKYLKNHGHTIFIMSGSPSEEIKNECLKFEFTLGIDYDKIISIVDYVKDNLRVPCWQDKSPRTSKWSWYCNDDIWWATKSILCDKYNIDILFDDKEQYQKFFGIEHKTKFILYTSEFDNIIINFF